PEENWSFRLADSVNENRVLIEDDVVPATRCMRAVHLGCARFSSDETPQLDSGDTKGVSVSAGVEASSVSSERISRRCFLYSGVDLLGTRRAAQDESGGDERKG